MTWTTASQRMLHSFVVDSKHINVICNYIQPYKRFGEKVTLPNGNPEEKTPKHCAKPAELPWHSHILPSGKSVAGQRRRVVIVFPYKPGILEPQAKAAGAAWRLVGE